MVQREMPNGRAYCIDTTEVTEGQYFAFLQEAPPVDEQATECLSNRSFDQLEPRVLDPETENYAVKVNWCDALAFCQWAGKRLCEVDVPNVTQEEAEIPQSQLSALFYGVDAVQNDEWLNACTAGGTQLYAWGNVWEDGACGGNVSSPGCADTSGELFGLSGNAAEWIAPCTDWYGCPFRSALLPGPDLPLDYGRCEYAQRSYPSAGLETGFRCCGEPLAGE